MIRRVLACTAAVMLAAVALAQYPKVPSEFLQGPPSGRKLSGDTITFCVDPRDPAHAVDREIGGAIAQALLLQPDFYTIERKLVTEDIEDVYLDLVNHCHVYLGFKLLAGAYPDWLVPTSAYYRTSYVVAVDDPSWHDITDIPRDRALGGMAGTAGDIRLLAYINALPADRRWARYPQASHEAALRAVLAGDLGGALVWAPALWAAARADPSLAALHVVDAKGVSEPIGVCGVVLAGNPFLLSSVDDAIAAITADGTIARILADHDFPGQAAPAR